MTDLRCYFFQCERCDDTTGALPDNVPVTLLCDECFKVMGEKPKDAMVCEYCGDHWTGKQTVMCTFCLNDSIQTSATSN